MPRGAKREDFDVPAYALTGGRVLGTDGRLTDASVIIADGLIDRVQPSGAPLDEGIRSIDCTGCTILPG